MSESLPAKLLSEVVQVAFNFTSMLDWGDTITAAEISVLVFSGTDGGPSDMISGTPVIQEETVLQNFQQGAPGVVYLIQCVVSTSSGRTLTLVRYLAVLSDEGSFLPSNLVRLVGILPNAISGVPYSEDLDILGGYPPYEAAGIVSGTAPFWMNFHVVGNHLVCSGTPNETSTVAYVFSPQIRDSANNLANAPQAMLSTHISIFGNVPDGQSGDSVSGSYGATNAQLPVTYTVYSGTFPTGITLNSDGTYSGTFSAGGTFSWVVQGTDAVSNVAYVSDTSVVGTGLWALLNSSGTHSNTIMWTSTDALSWTASYTKGDKRASGYGSVTAEDRIILTNNTSNAIQVIKPTAVAGVIDNYFVTTASLNYQVVYIDGVLIKYGANANYDVSTDQGDTWTAYPGPAGLWMKGVCKIGGLWIAKFQFSSTNRIYTSAETVPITWVYQYSGIGAVSGLTSDGVTALCVDNGKNTYTSVGGTVWVKHVNNFPYSLPGLDCAIISVAVGVFIIGTNNALNHALFRTTDSGSTWSTINLMAGRSNVVSLQFRYGKVVVSYVDGNVFVSTDLGLTFTQYNPAEGDPGCLILPFFPVT